MKRKIIISDRKNSNYAIRSVKFNDNVAVLNPDLWIESGHARYWESTLKQKEKS
jgi:hypothetical protein